MDVPLGVLTDQFVEAPPALVEKSPSQVLTVEHQKVEGIEHNLIVLYEPHNN